MKMLVERARCAGVLEARLTALEADCLRFIWAITRERGAAPAMNELQRIFGSDATVRLARAVRTLEEKGLVRLVPVIALEATPAGRAAFGRERQA